MFYYNSSAKHYQDIKERLREKARERRKRKKMGSIEKNIVK